MPTAPYFSIVIPSYNRADLLPATIEAILAQSFRDFEIIIVDDGSTDRTPEILESYGDKITAVRQENCGAEAARHNGFTHAQGEYLVLFDSDDILLPGALAIYHRVIQAFHLPPVVAASLRRFQSGDPLPTADCGDAAIEVLKYSNFLNRDRGMVEATPQLVVRRSIAYELRLFHPRPTAWPYEPCDFMLTLGCCEPFLAIAKPTTVGYRMHSGNDSGNFAYAIQMAPRFHHRLRTGAYPDGQNLSLARYAYLGGIQFALLHRSVKARKFGLAAKVVGNSWPMLLAAIARKITRLFRQQTDPILIPAAQSKVASSP